MLYYLLFDLWQVSGELSNHGQPMRRFMQTFVLAPGEVSTVKAVFRSSVLSSCPLFFLFYFSIFPLNLSKIST